MAALKKEDVMSLYQRLYERVVISKEFKDKFASLDHDHLKTELWSGIYYSMFMMQ